MQHKFYQGNSATYQITSDDSGIVYLHKLKQPLAVTSAMTAWEYITRYNNEKSCIDFIMKQFRITSDEELKKREISEERVNQLIEMYKSGNAS